MRQESIRTPQSSTPNNKESSKFQGQSNERFYLTLKSNKNSDQFRSISTSKPVSKMTENNTPLASGRRHYETLANNSVNKSEQRNSNNAFYETGNYSSNCFEQRKYSHSFLQTSTFSNHNSFLKDKS